MSAVAAWVLGASVFMVVYPYLIYPAILKLLTAGRRSRPAASLPHEWPTVTITLPVFNEAGTIREALERILALDYPADRRQILIVSDASTDGTDAIVRSFAPRAVELIRLPERAGKTAAENAAVAHVRGEIVVNTDASVRLLPGSLKPLVAALAAPDVGVASGRDVSSAEVQGDVNAGELAYVGYEMWVRELETRLRGIVGASGCFYASRREVYGRLIPEALSRDFCAPLVAKQQGLRSVSVAEAICLVPRARSLRREYRRKVRTMSRGLRSLFYMKNLMNPLNHGLFAWMLFSHKLARWFVPAAAVACLIATGVLAFSEVWARWLLAAAAAAGLATVLGWMWPRVRSLPWIVTFPTYIVSGLLAGLHAWVTVLRGDFTPTWEPTRRQ